MRSFCFFFFNDTATTEIYTLSLHDALPIWPAGRAARGARPRRDRGGRGPTGGRPQPLRRRDGRLISRGPRPSPRDRKSTRLNSSHANISYAVFCLKKKKNTSIQHMLFSPLR